MVLALESVVLLHADDSATSWFDKAAASDEAGRHDEALAFYLKALELSPSSGFTTARIGQHYWLYTVNYDKAIGYYRDAYKLGFKNDWSLKQQIKTLIWISHYRVAEGKFTHALAAYDEIYELLRRHPELIPAFDDIADRRRMVELRAALTSVKPEATHKTVLVLVNETNYDKDGVTVKASLSNDERALSLISAKCLVEYLLGMTRGAWKVEFKVLEWTNPIMSLSVAGPEAWILDLEGLSREMEKLLGPVYADTDSFVLIWPSGSYQSAHGGASRFFLDGGKKSAWRGMVQIPALRMLINGPTLLLHEFFHTTENMAGIDPRHGFQDELRVSFPLWKGTGEFSYYLWQFGENIPRLLPELKEAGWGGMNFKSLYPIKMVK